MITTIAIIIFSQGIPSYGFSCFSRRESARISTTGSSHSTTFPVRNPTGGAFLPHPDILTRMVGGNLGFITEFFPAVLAGELERDLFSGNDHTEPYRIVTYSSHKILCPGHQTSYAR